MVPQPWGATAKKNGRGSKGQSRNSTRETPVFLSDHEAVKLEKPHLKSVAGGKQGH